MEKQEASIVSENLENPAETCSGETRSTDLSMFEEDNGRQMQNKTTSQINNPFEVQDGLVKASQAEDDIPASQFKELLNHQFPRFVENIEINETTGPGLLSQNSIVFDLKSDQNCTTVSSVSRKRESIEINEQVLQDLCSKGFISNFPTSPVTAVNNDSLCASPKKHSSGVSNGVSNSSRVKRKLFPGSDEDPNQFEKSELIQVVQENSHKYEFDFIQGEPYPEEVRKRYDWIKVTDVGSS